MTDKPGSLLMYLSILGLAMAVSLTSVILSAEADSTSGNGARGEAAVQMEPTPIDPAGEQLDEVSDPVGEISERLADTPTETLNSVSKTMGEVSENIESLSNIPETIGEASETADEAAGEQVGAVSETAEEAYENIPIAPEGDGSGLEYDTRESEMPLGDREAEGIGIGE